MNIVIDVRPLMGGKHSGVEIYIRKLLEHLFKIDKKNHYVLFANSSSDQTRNLPRFDLPNVKTVQTRIPNKILNFGLFLFKRPRIDLMIKKQLPGFNPDLYFLPDLRPFSLSGKIKKISVVHDLSFFHFPGYFSIKTRIWHKLLNPKKLLRDFDGIIAVSDSTRLDLTKTFGIKPEKISVIHEGIEENFCTGLDPKKSAEIRTRYMLPKNFFLFLSTLEPRKNLPRLIEAFKNYKIRHQDNLKLVLVGTSNQKIFSKLHIKPHPDLVLTGFIPETDKPYVFSMAKAFLYPSLFEGFGLPLLEAMKCGTPLITSSCSSMPEICADAALYVDPRNTAQIAEAMELILQPQIYESLKRSMAKRIRNFSWEKCARETIKLFESI